MTTINNSEVEALYVIFSGFFSSSSSYFYTFRCTLICSVLAGAVAVVFNCTARIYLFLIIDRAFIIVFSPVVVVVVVVRLLFVPRPCERSTYCDTHDGALLERQTKMWPSENEHQRQRNKKNLKYAAISFGQSTIGFFSLRYENRWCARLLLITFFLSRICFIFWVLYGFDAVCFDRVDVRPMGQRYVFRERLFTRSPIALSDVRYFI